MGNIHQTNNSKQYLQGQAVPSRHKSCMEVCEGIYQDTALEIQRLYPFSSLDDQKPYAVPVQTNIYAPSKQLQNRIQKIIQTQSESLRKPLYKKKSSMMKQLSKKKSQKTQSIQNSNKKQNLPRNELVKEQSIKQNQMMKKKSSSAQRELQKQNQQEYVYDEKYWKKEHPQVVIQGHWKQHLPHGLCRVYFPQGQIFVSYFDNGKPFLEDCIIIFQNGSYYHGGLNNFKLQGENGKFVSQDDTIIFQGQWKNGVPCGKGVQTFSTQKQIISYEGQFNKFGQKEGQNTSYIVKNKSNNKNTIYEYKGAFKQNQLYGQGILMTNNGQNILKANFGTTDKDHQDEYKKVKVYNLQTKQFNFQGELQRSFIDGQGKFIVQNKNIPKESSDSPRLDLQNKKATTIYSGEVKHGKLYGKGSIIKGNSQNEENVQNVFWFDGIKLKHLKNFYEDDQLRIILTKIEQQFQKAAKYSQLTKTLTDYFNTHHYHSQVNRSGLNIPLSSASPLQKDKQKQRFLFQMISEQKAKIIIHGSHVTSKSPLKPQQRKQLILQLDKGKYLYMSSYKINLQQSSVSNKNIS